MRRNFRQQGIQRESRTERNRPARFQKRSSSHPTGPYSGVPHPSRAVCEREGILTLLKPPRGAHFSPHLREVGYLQVKLELEPRPELHLAEVSGGRGYCAECVTSKCSV